ncbi:MAG: sodium-dependent transporter [Burkholderiaceae bacterium]|nr:MAG: sodium-dependent transporter [Burkholderiaceae bacterium]
MSERDGWSGRAGFVLATIGSAVGIGSIWKFPYEVGANGGSGFLLFYLLGLALVVLPLMLAEFAIGRRGGGDPVTSMAAVAKAFGAHRGWSLAGGAGVVTGFLILSFYSVIGGWTAGYAVQTLTQGLPAPQAQAAQARFDAFLAEPWPMIGYHAVFMTVTALIVVRGVSGGIESACKVLMPLLLVLMLGLVGYAVVEGDLGATLRFLFTLDPDRIGARTVIEALGLGFFSIGVGLGLMMTYAAYSGRTVRLVEVAAVSVVADTLISLLAGFAVFPVVFAHGLDPAGGPGLVFVTLPLAFAGMPAGTAAACAFFVLVFVAALASSISMLELVVAMLVRRRGWSRRRATLLAAVACFAVGVPSALSFNVLAGWHPLAGIPAFAQANLFTLIDELTSNVLLPAVGLAFALFAGWALPPGALDRELLLSARAAAVLRGLLRWGAPAAIAVAALVPMLG